MLLWGLYFFNGHWVIARRDSNRHWVVGLGGVTAAYSGILELAWVQKAVNLQQNRLQHALATHGVPLLLPFSLLFVPKLVRLKLGHVCLSVCLQFHPCVSSVGISEV